MCECDVSYVQSRLFASGFSLSKHDMQKEIIPSQEYCVFTSLFVKSKQNMICSRSRTTTPSIMIVNTEEVTWKNGSVIWVNSTVIVADHFRPHSETPQSPTHLSTCRTHLWTDSFLLLHNNLNKLLSRVHVKPPMSFNVKRRKKNVSLSSRMQTALRKPEV